MEKLRAHKSSMRPTLAAVFSMLVMLAEPARAATWCGGYIKAVLTDAGGVVMVLPSFRNDWLQICNITTTWKGVTVDICKTWVATVTALRLTQEVAVLHYAENTACNGIPSYGGAYAPAYISIDPP